MNYRHAFHAGNVGDCVKHAVLIWLLRAMQRKPAPLFVLDTHAGAGRYDLNAGPAARTGEWHKGIARLLDDPPAPLTDYVSLVRTLGLYPGSPALIHSLLRRDDRLACCELHPEDAAVLKRMFADDPQVGVHQRDAWESLKALLPPKEKRGLVLIDPPFEHPREFDQLVEGLRTAHSRFPTGVFAAWYPIKHRAPVRDFHARLRETAMRDIVAAELWLREPIDPARLNGCGMLLINPPWRFDEDLPPVLNALLDRIGTREAGEGAALTRLADE